MDLVQRAKNICLSPTTEWPVIEAEQTPPATLITQYVVPLAALGAVAGLIGGSLVGRTIPFVGTYRVPIATGLVGAVFALVMAVGALIGGMLGGRLAGRVKPATLRWIVVVIGVVVSIIYFIRG